MDDDLSAWAAERGEGFFLKPEPGLLDSLRTVSSWASSNAYEPSAVNTVLQKADYYLIAQACAGGDTVVTHERPSDSTRKIKIPDVCIGMRIKCVTPYEMLRAERARFVLG